ncbi:MAG: hypothetical protein DELT_00998 [Desulfovibrio sp.]
MKRIFENLLGIAVVEAVHFIFLTAILCLIGFFTRADGSAVTFRQLLWNGGVSFWFDGYGAILLFCLVAVGGWMVLAFFADRKALEEKRKGLDQEAWEAGHRLAAMMRPELETSIEQAYESKFADREAALAQDEKSLSWRYKVQAEEQRALGSERIELEDQKRKVRAWKLELDALRSKSEIYKERRAQLKRRIRWAEEALAEDPSNVGLALRHLKKAEKE